MNPLPPNVDELVSAYLDGEATADEIVVVESNTEMMSRVNELRAISTAIAAPVVAPADLKDSHITAALGVFDELFPATSTTTDDSPVVPVIPVGPVITAVAPLPPGRPDDDAAAGTTAVVSFEAARERRSRRFNTRVMAATAAAMVLVVALAALSFGRSSQSDDVATSAAENFEASSAEASAGDPDAAADPDAADAATSSAMVAPENADDAAHAADEVSELDANRSVSPPAVAADAAQAEPMDEAMSDSAMDTAEQSDAAGAAEAAPFALDILLGTFADEAELRDELEKTTAEDLRERIDAFEPGVTRGCQLAVPDLAAVDSVTLVGQALVADRLVELHFLNTENYENSFVVIDPAADCSIVSIIPG